MTTDSNLPYRIAVVGAGVAGAACARALRDAGHTVHLFDKSRGAGGRMATRCERWVDASGRDRSTRFDHGAPGFDARSPAFRKFTADALRGGWLKAWSPVHDSRGLGSANPGPTLVPVPDMPTLCRRLVHGIDVSFGHAVQSLQRGPLGWSLHGDGGDGGVGGVGEVIGQGFDALVLALPPAQAGHLLAGHQPGWARHAALALMQPCWTLMGVATAPVAATGWHVARPHSGLQSGPLCVVQRNDCRPGREQRSGEVHWVLHARAAWSRLHLEQSAEWVQAQLQTALADWLGEPVHWQHAVTHRWRYATPLAGGGNPGGSAGSELGCVPTGRCWWDSALGLGVCGDFLGGGGSGVEAAWLSAQALATQILPGDNLCADPAARVAQPAEA